MDGRERERVSSGFSTEAAILLIVLLLIFLSMIMLTVMCCKMSSVEWQLRRMSAPTFAPAAARAPPLVTTPTEYFYPY